MGEQTVPAVGRNYTVTIRIPQTLRLPADGLERHLKEDSEPFRRLLAKNMIEDWQDPGLFGVFEDDEDRERAIEELAHWIAGATLDKEWEDELFV